MALHPQLAVSLVLTDRFVDPLEEGFDVALHVGEPGPDQSGVPKDMSDPATDVCKPCLSRDLRPATHA
jgi:DNA-binding transcriptional LysR family regulator